MAQAIETRKKFGDAPLVGGQTAADSRARRNSDKEANHKKAWAAYLKVCRENESVLRTLAKM